MIKYGLALLLGIFFVILSTIINTYIGINFGMGFGFGLLALIASFIIFKTFLKNFDRNIVSLVFIIGTSMLTIHNILGTGIMLVEKFDATLPEWFIPSKNILEKRILVPSIWVTPILIIFVINIMSTLLGLLYTITLYKNFIEEERLVFPNIAASATMMDALFTGGEEVKIVFLSILTGFTISLVQQILLLFKINIYYFDLTPFLPKGIVFAFSLSIGFMAVGYIISASTSLSTLLSGLITYFIISPYSISKGIIPYSKDIRSLYSSLVFKVTLSPAMGILILGGIGLSIFGLIMRGKKKHGYKYGYIDLYYILWRRMIGNKKVFITMFLLTILLGISVYILNPLAPLHPFYSLIFFIYSVFIGSFLELVLLVRMIGESGMGMGIFSIVLYDIPIFLTGYRAYSGYMTGSMFIPSSWTAPSIIGLMKYNDKFDISLKEIVGGKIVGWIVSFIVSSITTLLLWRYRGFGTISMPAVGLLQQAVYINMLAKGNISGTIDPFTFIVGGVVGSILEVATPLSMIGIALGMLIPPQYVIALGVGGIIRFLTDRKMGKEYFKKRGMLIATGLLTSSLLVEIISIIIRSVQNV